MKNIRSSVFETNSSSTHSISIDSNADGILDTIVPNDEGALILTGGSFGWAWEKFNDSLTKANYCAVDTLDHAERAHMLAEVLVEHTGAKKIIFAIDDNSYVDHQSVGTSEDAFVSPQTLKNFIFNPSSWLFTGNDNEDSHPNFYDVEKNIVYTYELKMDGIENISIKFKNYPSSEELQEACIHMGHQHPLQFRKSFDDFESPDDYYEQKPYQWYSYNRELNDGSSVSSLDKIQQNMVTFYKVERVYEYSPEAITKYNRDGLIEKGDKLIEAIDISFNIIPIN